MHLRVLPYRNQSECIIEMIEERMFFKCKNICYATQGIGSHVVPVTPVTSRKVYWSVCLYNSVID